jgi:hypothetical protein
MSCGVHFRSGLRCVVSPVWAPRAPRRAASRCHRKMVVPSSPTPSPASVTGRQVASAGMTNAAIAATSQASAPTAMTGHGSSSAPGSGGGSRLLPGWTDIEFKIARRRCGPRGGRGRSWAVKLARRRCGPRRGWGRSWAIKKARQSRHGVAGLGDSSLTIGRCVVPFAL